MKTLLITAALAAAALSGGSAWAENVTVTLTGVKAQGGNLLVALQTEDEFLQPRGHLGTVVPAPARDGTVTVTVNDVPPGRYSLSVLHDVDGDMQMKMGADSRPAEGWAMHNGAALRGAPTWPAVNFAVGNGPVALTEAMIYPR
jgi:uncharacterized protein (DUF2141 family)